MDDFIETLWNTHLDLSFPPELGRHPSYWKNVEKSGLREVAFSGNLGWLLNPKSNHRQGTKPVQMLLEAARRPDIVPLVTENAQTELENRLPSIEYVDSGTRRVDRLDILIKDETTKVVIAIEVKVRAKEHFDKNRNSQLKVYREKVKATYESIEGWKHVFIFLTPNGEVPRNRLDDEKLGVTESKWYDEWVCLDFKTLWPIFEAVVKRTSVQFEETLDEDFLDTRCIIRDLYTFTRVEFFEYFKRESNITRKELAKFYDGMIDEEIAGSTRLQRIVGDPRAFAEAKRLWDKKLAATDSNRAKDTHRSMIKFEEIFFYLLGVEKDSMATVPTRHAELDLFEKDLYAKLKRAVSEDELSPLYENFMAVIINLMKGLEENNFRPHPTDKKIVTVQDRDKSLTVWDLEQRRAWIRLETRTDIRPYLKIRFDCTQKRAESAGFDAVELKSKLSMTTDLQFHAPLAKIGSSKDKRYFADVRLDHSTMKPILESLTAFSMALRKA